MPGAYDSLLREGLAVLGKMLPPGYTLARSSLREKDARTEAWIVIGRPNSRPVTCLVIARRRAERRDVGTIAAHTARSKCPVLLVTPTISPEMRKRLRAFGVGSWDLTGSAQIDIRDLNLSLRREGTASPEHGGSRAQKLRSLAGEMTARVVRALLDVRPPYRLAEVARSAQVDTSCASRVVAFLADAGLLRRQPRGMIEAVDWQAILARWRQDAPPESRSQSRAFVYGRGIADFFARLGASGFLHALTGESAFARLAEDASVPTSALLYVEDFDGAAAQFGLHPVDDGDATRNVTLRKPTDRSVFARSRETAGLRLVSPSLMVADTSDDAAFRRIADWMAANEMTWRQSP